MTHGLEEFPKMIMTEESWLRPIHHEIYRGRRVGRRSYLHRLGSENR